MEQLSLFSYGAGQSSMGKAGEPMNNFLLREEHPPHTRTSRRKPVLPARVEKWGGEGTGNFKWPDIKSNRTGKNRAHILWLKSLWKKHAIHRLTDRRLACCGNEAIRSVNTELGKWPWNLQKQRVWDFRAFQISNQQCLPGLPKPEKQLKSEVLLVSSISENGHFPCLQL